jgi:hypothetical protein
MYEDPFVIELNIRHYRQALMLPCTQEKRQRLLRLLAKAWAELPFAEAERDRAFRGAEAEAGSE